MKYTLIHNTLIIQYMPHIKERSDGFAPHVAILQRPLGAFYSKQRAGTGCEPTAFERLRLMKSEPDGGLCILKVAEYW